MIRQKNSKLRTQGNINGKSGLVGHPPYVHSLIVHFSSGGETDFSQWFTNSLPQGLNESMFSTELKLVEQ